MKSKANESQGMLLFRLSATQMFAIGTLKVREIVPFRHLTALPGSHHTVIGTANIRGITTPVIDMAKASGIRPSAKKSTKTASLSSPTASARLSVFGAWDRKDQ